MWHHDVSFMQEKNKNKNTQNSHFLEHMIRVQDLPMKGEQVGDWGSQPFSFPSASQLWLVNKTARGTLYWTVPRARASQAARAVAGWKVLYRTLEGWDCHVLMEKERQRLLSFVFCFFSRKVSESSETFSKKKKIWLWSWTRKPGHLSSDDAWHMKMTHGDKRIGGDTQAPSGEVLPCSVGINRNKLMCRRRVVGNHLQTLPSGAVCAPVFAHGGIPSQTCPDLGLHSLPDKVPLPLLAV